MLRHVKTHYLVKFLDNGDYREDHMKEIIEMLYPGDKNK